MADIVPVKAEIEPREPDKYEKFIDMYSRGMTQREISEIIEISEPTLYLWKQKSDFTDKLLIARKKNKRDDLLTADRCVRNNLRADNLKAAELIYKREGELIENQTNVQVNISLDDFIEAEKLIDKG